MGRESLICTSAELPSPFRRRVSRRYMSMTLRQNPTKVEHPTPYRVSTRSGPQSTTATL